MCLCISNDDDNAVCSHVGVVLPLTEWVKDHHIQWKAIINTTIVVKKQGEN